MPTLKACSSGWPARDPYNGLANSPVSQPDLRNQATFGWDAPILCQEPLFGNIVQLLCNENFNRLACRCTPITSANDGASCGSAVFRRAGRKWPDPSTQGRLSLLTRRAS